MSQAEPEEVSWWVYEESLLRKLASGAGWLLGWGCFWAVGLGLRDPVDGAIDLAIVLRRHNRGAIRAIGRLNAHRGLRALRRGRLLVTGRIHETGPFAHKGFYATYDVAAPNKARALALIRRFEWDALPESLEIDEGELDQFDPGAEGVLWVAPGRTFFTQDSPASGREPDG
ncbi:MAG TPA: hypothetical protein VGD66_15435 [Allosphingosinicella sp.]